MQLIAIAVNYNRCTYVYTHNTNTSLPLNMTINTKLQTTFILLNYSYQILLLVNLDEHWHIAIWIGECLKPLHPFFPMISTVLWKITENIAHYLTLNLDDFIQYIL